MRRKYKGCDIEVSRQGSEVIEYSILDNDCEIDSSFIESQDTVKDVYRSMKRMVDEYKNDGKGTNLITKPKARA